MPRPVLAADVERLAAGAAQGEPHARMELAHATAAAVVEAGRGAGNGDADEPAERMVRLAETVGLETLAELWRDASPDTLPGALWTLYLLRTWCLENGEEVARLYRAGRALAPVDEVVAGVHDDADLDAVGTLADSVLTGVYGGDLAVALERGAAFFRVVAAGREQLAADGAEGQDESRRAARNRACADSLSRAARSWRAGTLH
jgi:hypothetical protein